MSNLHIDWTLAQLVAATVTAPGKTAGGVDRKDARTHALVLTDGGNEIAFGIEGTARELLRLAVRITQAVADAVTAEADARYASAFGADQR